MSRPGAALVTGDPAEPVDLRGAPLGTIGSRLLRAIGRDFWADEAALWERLVRSWHDLDEAAWHAPGVAPSDTGGPPWSLAEHVGHIADWQELAAAYTSRALETGLWPTVADYGGDFDQYNEGRRQPWASMAIPSILDRLVKARDGLLETARALSSTALRGDDAWSWVYPALHGHYLDHLAVIEPQADRLRAASATDPAMGPTHPATVTSEPATGPTEPATGSLDAPTGAAGDSR